MNKKLSIEIAVGMIVLIAGFFGISFWLSISNKHIGGTQKSNDQHNSIQNDREIKKNYESEDISKLCADMAYVNSKDRCYADYALSRNTKQLCDKIYDKQLKQECISNFDNKNRADRPILNSLGSNPDAIGIGEEKSITFITMQTGSEERGSVFLEEIDASGMILRRVGSLNDEGKRGDLSADDLVYGGTFNIGSAQESILYFRAKKMFTSENEPIMTDIYEFGITRFPTDDYAFDLTKIVTNPLTKEKIISNMVMVGFKERIDPAKIEEIANSVGGKVVSVSFALNSYKIIIPDSNNTSEVEKVILRLYQYPEVEYAETIGLSEINN